MHITLEECEYQMKKLVTGILSITAVGALALTGCGKSGSPTDSADGGTEAPEYTVASDVKLDGSPTMKRIEQNGKIKIGMAMDSPGLSYKGTTDKEPKGYNVEVAKIAAASLGLGPDKIEYVDTSTPNREPFLQNGQVDMVVSSYTINDERKKVIDFAGPYYNAGQDLLIKDDDDSIKSKGDLAGKTVCSTAGSTPAQNIKANFKETKLVTYDNGSKCLSDLQSGNVDAYTTDDIVLRGYAAANEGLKVVGDPFTEEPYGVGLPKGDKEMREAVNDGLEKGGESGNGDMKKAWSYVFKTEDGYQDPKVDRY
jgi:glutamate transport system substrate-binding protein